MTTQKLNFDLTIGGVGVQKQRTFPVEMGIGECLRRLKEDGQQFSSYGVKPGEGYIFNLV